jgi:hypothetical protein
MYKPQLLRSIVTVIQRSIEFARLTPCLLAQRMGQEDVQNLRESKA